MPSPAWYNNIWPYRFKITPNAVNGDLYYDFSLAPSSFWDHVRSDGGDIRVTKEDGTTEVAREISGFDSTGKKGSLYIATGGGTAFYVYFGVANATEPYAGSTYGSQAVWGANAQLVAHLVDNANDSSAIGANGTLFNSPTFDNVAGAIAGKALNLDGINDYASFPNAAGAFSDGIVMGMRVKNKKTATTTIAYQAESVGGASTGDNYSSWRRGRAGIDTAGGTLFDYVIPSNGFFGTVAITANGYQSDIGVVAGTILLTDNETGDTLYSGNLIKRASGDSDKRLNDGYIRQVNGHDIRVRIYFAGTCDLYVDRVDFIRSGYDALLGKSGVIQSNTNGGVRTYLNNNVNQGTYSVVPPDTDFTDLVWVYNKTNIKLYYNGVLRGTWAYTTALNSNANVFLLGKDIASGTGYYSWFYAQEAFVYKDPANWDATRISNRYANLSSPSTFWTTGNIETKSTSTVQRDSGFGIRTTSITSKSSSFGIGRTEQVQKGSSFGIKRTTQLAHDAGLAILRLFQIVKDSAFTIGRSSSVQKSSSFAVLNTDRVTKFSGFAIKRYPFKQRTSPLSARSGIFTPKSRIINPLPPFDENN